MAGVTFVTGWFRRHGLGYVDVVVGALENLGRSALERGRANAGERLAEARDQYELARWIGYGDGDGRALRALDRVVVLVPRADAKGLPAWRLEDVLSDAPWSRVTTSCELSMPGSRSLLSALRGEIEATGRFPELPWFEEHWSGHEHLLWHLINEAPVATQVAWYRKHSPLFKANKDRVELVTLDVADLEKPEPVTAAMHSWLVGQETNSRLLVNLWGTPTTVQFGWYYLAWRYPALKDALFLKCWDDKDKKAEGHRFAPVTIEVMAKDPIGSLTGAQPVAWGNDDRKKSRAFLEYYLDQGDNFTVLVVGERGTGKTTEVRDAWERCHPGAPFVTANCADFRGDPGVARAELFGYVRGAHSTAKGPKAGLLERANGGLLFLDEVHHLDNGTRSTLLTALQTNHQGEFTIRRMGADQSTQITFQPVFASNNPAKMRKLEPDFVDRISQRILEWPSLALDELDGAWDDVWKNMKFQALPEGANPIHEDWFLPWLRARHPFAGNFRDLERIAILVADYRRMAARGIANTLPLQDHLEARLQDRIELNAPPPTGRAPAVSVNDAPKGVLVPFQFDADHATESVFLDEARRVFANAATDRYGSQTAAVQALRVKGSRMTKAKMHVWRNLGRD